MIIHVANPIYDSVFKYLMEDERIAKTMLSALLKKEVIHVTFVRMNTATRHVARCRDGIVAYGNTPSLDIFIETKSSQIKMKHFSY